MSYLGENSEPPMPDIDDAPFWEAAKNRRLVFQCCAECGHPRHPPGPVCPRCHSLEHTWIEAPNEGEVFSFTFTHVAGAGVAPASVPYNVALVAFPELGDLRLITNIVNVEPGQLRIGARVRLVWERGSGGFQLPRFELSGEGGE